MSNVAGVGATLRALRKARGMTLNDVAAVSGIPRSTLSRIETGQNSPTLDNLNELGRALDVDIVELLARPSADDPAHRTGRRSVNRLTEGKVIELGGKSLRYLNTDLLAKKFTPIVATITTETLEAFGPLMHHAGDEFLYVLEGELAFHSDTYAPVILKAGEALYFDASMGHAYVAHGGPCVTLSICETTRPSETIEASPTVSGKKKA